MSPTALPKTAINGKKDRLAPTAKDNRNEGDDESPIAPDPKRRKQAAAKRGAAKLTAPVAAEPVPRSRSARSAPAPASRPARAARARAQKAVTAAPEPGLAASDPVDLDASWTGDALSLDEIDAVYERAATRAARMPTFRLPAIVALLVIVILAVALVFFIRKVQHQDSVNSLRSSAVTAATTYGGYLASYDYRNLTGPSSAWAQVEAHATASFKKDFTQTSGTLGKVLTQYNATAKGKVVAGGLSSVSGSRAVVLLFIDQTVTNTVQKPNSVTQPLRVQLTMLRQHGQWLIDNLQLPN